VVTATQLATIAADDSSSVAITVQVGAGAVPSVTNRAVVRTAGDADPANNADADTASVLGVDLALDKRHVGPFTLGGDGDYQFRVRNVGTAATFDQFTVVDTLPAGLTYVSGSGAGWTFTANGQLFTATQQGPLVPGASVSCDVRV